MRKETAVGALALAGGATFLARRSGWLGGGKHSLVHHQSETEAGYRAAGTRILILGGGFGGVNAALELDRQIGSRPDTSMLLVERNNSMQFTPLLWTVANGTTNPNSVVLPVRSFQKRRTFHIVQATVERIDLENRTVHLAGADPRPYDKLIIALGSITSVPDLPGLRDRALIFRSPADAMQLRNRLVDAIEAAHRATDEATRREWLTFVVGGGGDTGVEVAATIHDYLTSALLKQYPWLSDQPVRVVIVSHTERLVSAHMEVTSEAVEQSVLRKDIEVMAGVDVTGVTERSVQTSKGEIPARTMFWAAGVSAPPVVRNIPGIDHAKNGSIVVDKYMRIPNHPEVYVIGDSAWGFDAETGEPLPALAQAAEQQGRAIARNVAIEVEGGEPQPYSFSPRGILILLGQHAGVSQLGPATLISKPPFFRLGTHEGREIGPLMLTGLPAWLLWHAYYLSHVPVWRNRIHVLTDWLLAGLIGRETSQLRLQPTDTPRRPVAVK